MHGIDHIISWMSCIRSTSELKLFPPLILNIKGGKNRRNLKTNKRKIQACLLSNSFCQGLPSSRCYSKKVRMFVPALCSPWQMCDWILQCPAASGHFQSTSQGTGTLVFECSRMPSSQPSPVTGTQGMLCACLARRDLASPDLPRHRARMDQVQLRSPLLAAFQQRGSLK